MSSQSIFAFRRDRSKYELNDHLDDIETLKNDVDTLKNDVININDDIDDMDNKINNMISVIDGVEESVEPHTQAVVHLGLSELSDAIGVESFNDFIENWQIIGLEQSFDISLTNKARWGQGAYIEYIDALSSYFAYPHYTIADKGESVNSEVILHLFNPNVNAKNISWKLTLVHVQTEGESNE